MIDRWIAEATECDFKVALEVRRPKSWLKSVSAFANGIAAHCLSVLMMTELKLHRHSWEFSKTNNIGQGMGQNA